MALKNTIIHIPEMNILKKTIQIQKRLPEMFE